MRAPWRVAAIASVLTIGCVADDELAFEREGELPLTPGPSIQRVPAPLPAAHCTIDVEGVGTIDMEEDYLPHVIHCENGGANLEALKAQAIAARSVAYYAIETSGGICDSQGCQVYSCGSDPTPMQIQAVQETSGLYLNYNNTLTYAFFVAGDSGVAPPGCIGNDGAASTEHWVTYNEGQSGTNVQQTELGFVHEPADVGYGQNRGCMGQWAARCLENDNGYDYLGILRFFYGDDIGVTQAAGACVLPLPGETTTGGGDAGDTSGGLDTTGGADTSGGPPPTTTMPLTTDPGDSSGDASMTGGPLESEDDAGTAEGTSDDPENALPATYGENTDAPAGCACTTTPTTSGWLAALVLLAVCRRRN